jgi:glucokinase
MSSANIDAFRDVALRDELAVRLGVPVHVDNDANLAALSEAWDDDLHLLHESLVAITVGTGIGGGAVMGGRPLHGSQTSAFELGHLIVAADLTDGAPAASDPPAPASLEYWASGRALDRLARERGYEGGPAITDAAEAGDAVAVDALRILGERLGVGIASVVTLFEPEAVVIGGGVSRAGELLVGPAREAAKRLLLPGLGTKTEIRVAQHGPQAGLRGAALLARIEESTPA